MGDLKKYALLAPVLFVGQLLGGFVNSVLPVPGDAFMAGIISFLVTTAIIFFLLKRIGTKHGEL